MSLNLLHDGVGVTKMVTKMKSEKINRIYSLFNDETTVLSTAILNKNGIYTRNITELVNTGFLSRVRQGYYILNQAKSDISDIVLVSKLIPKGVLCLYSATEYYDLSTVNPQKIYIALPRGTVAPSLPEYLQVNVRQMINKYYELGISTVDFDGAPVKIYDMEKTVCDCFKYDNEVEKVVSLEILKNYVSNENCNIQKLLEYAKVLGKRKTILPYIEAMI